MRPLSIAMPSGIRQPDDGTSDGLHMSVHTMLRRKALSNMSSLAAQGAPAGTRAAEA